MPWGCGRVRVSQGRYPLLFTPIRLGRLPGDIYIRGRNTSFYFPIVTCLLLSVGLSVVLWLIRLFRGS